MWRSYAPQIATEQSLSGVNYVGAHPPNCRLTIAQLSGDAADLYRLVCVSPGLGEAVGKPLRALIKPTAGGGSAIIVKVR